MEVVRKILDRGCGMSKSPRVSGVGFGIFSGNELVECKSSTSIPG